MWYDNIYYNLDFLLNNCQFKFDVIMVVKFVNKIYRKEYSNNEGMYKLLIETVSDYLSRDGLFILADVTDKIENNDDLYLPKIMNKEIVDYLNSTDAKLRPIIPLSCAFWYESCTAKKENCFTQRKIPFKLNYSKNYNNNKNSRDLYKFNNLTYKVFAHKIVAEKILEKIERKKHYKIAEGKACIEGTYIYEWPISANKYPDAFSFCTFK